MKKNNKGFTLIEIIGVVVIIGIMAIVAVPRIVDLVSNSRKDIYVQDAKRFISKAQYEMNAGNEKIEKPDIDECIVISLSYVSDRDFKEAPYNGEYLTDSSFVVVRNVRGKYYYSAMLIEKKKDNKYIGIELSTEKELSNKNAKSHVRYFTEEEVVVISDENITTSSGDSVDMANYINNNIQAPESEKNLWYTETGDIVGYYYSETGRTIDDTGNSTTPRISAKFGNNGGSLKTTLSVTATDADDAYQDLTICLKVSRDGSDSYLTPRDDNCFPYGSDAVYVWDVDLTSNLYGNFTHRDSEAYFYVTVADPSGNLAHKKLRYSIHGNEPPVIALFKAVKQDGDSYQMPKAKLTIDVLDDVDVIDQLRVCLIQDDAYAAGGLDKSGDCVQYVPFTSVFNNNGVGYYEFVMKNNDSWKKITVPDGTKHTLTIKVKDSYDAIATSNASYTIYKNSAPVFQSSSVEGIPVVVNGVKVGNGLKAKINLSIADDISSPDKIKLTIGDVVTTYADYLNGNKMYTFPGKLDGNNKSMTVNAADEYGSSTSISVTLTNVYHGSAPIIRFLSVSGVSSPCTGASSCYNSENGGNVTVNYSLELSDDVTQPNDLLVCVSENESDCSSEKTARVNFMRFGDIRTVYIFDDYSDNYKYPPEEKENKKLYAAVIDGDGYYSAVEEPIDYKIYHNFAPEIIGDYAVNVTNKTDTSQTLMFDFEGMNVEDDFSNFKSSYCYKYASDSNYTCTEYDSYRALQLALLGGVEHNYSDGDISIYFQFKDNYGKEANSRVTVEHVPVDNAPIINLYKVESTDTRFNSNTVKISFSVTDPGDEYQVCFSESSETCNKYMGNGTSWFSGDLVSGSPQKNSLTINGADAFSWSSTYENNKSRKTIYMFVKDKHNHISIESADYNIYRLCSNEAAMVVDFSSNDYTPRAYGETPISPSMCQGKCYHNFETTSNTSHVNYMNDVNSHFGQYNHSVRYIDTFVNISCTKIELEDLYCDYADCFNLNNDKRSGVYVDLNLQEENLVWSFSTPRASEDTTSVENPLCANPPGDPLFNMNDARCTDSHYCADKVDSYCESECEKGRVAAQKAYEEERELAADAYISLLRMEYSSYIDYCECSLCEKVLACDDNGGTNHGSLSFRRVFKGGDDTPIGGDFDCNSVSLKLYSRCTDRKDSGKACRDCDIYYKEPEKSNCDDLLSDRFNLETYLTEARAKFIEDYKPFSYSCNKEPGNGTSLKDNEYTKCYRREMTTCNTYLESFCNEPTTSAKYEVSCESSSVTDGPYYCKKSGYSDGYCLGDIDTCEGETSLCQRVCYQSVTCDLEAGKKNETFLCHGYFKSYKAVKSGSVITLKDTGLKVCPDFYRLYPDKFAYDSTDLNPYLVFNSSEQEGENNG